MRHARTAVPVLAVVAALALAAAPAAGRRALAEDPPAPQAPPAATTGVVRLTILHTNDLHGHLETFPVVAGVAKAERARNPNTLFLDGGDCITGTVVSTVYEGTPIFELMNGMGYDAGVIGNHEFDHGWQKVHGFRETATYPLVCANAKDPDGKPFGDSAWRILDCGGVKVGVIGLLTGDLAMNTTAAATAGVVVEKPIDAARRLVPEVRAKADLVVLLTHCGVDVDAALAGSVPGIDLIVGGHSHTRLPKALRSPRDTGRTPIVQAGRYGECLGVVDLEWDPAARRVTKFDSKLVVLHGEGAAPGLPEDPEVRKAVDGWMAKVRHYEEAIGRTAAKLSRSALRPLLERIYKETLGADLGYQNARGIRDEVRAGDIRVLDVFSVLPFENTLVKVRVPGAKLSEYQRKQIGASFDPEKEYVIATNSYVADHRDRFFGSKSLAAEDTKIGMRDAVVAWVRKHGGFLPKGDAAPAPDESDDPR